MNLARSIQYWSSADGRGLEAVVRAGTGAEKVVASVFAVGVFGLWTGEKAGCEAGLDVGEYGVEAAEPSSSGCSASEIFPMPIWEWVWVCWQRERGCSV